jgi:hypothetical protein
MQSRERDAEQRRNEQQHVERIADNQRRDGETGVAPHRLRERERRAIDAALEIGRERDARDRDSEQTDAEQHAHRAERRFEAPELCRNPAEHAIRRDAGNGREGPLEATNLGRQRRRHPEEAYRIVRQRFYEHGCRYDVGAARPVVITL